MFVKDGTNIVNTDDISRISNEFEGYTVLYLRGGPPAIASTLDFSQWEIILNPVNVGVQDEEVR